MSGPAYRMTFLVPRALRLSAMPGRHQPCLAGCILLVGRGGLVSIDGPSRERVFDQARRFLKITAKGHGAQSIVAVLEHGRHRDGWTIIINSDVAFSPTSLPPDLGLPPPGGEVIEFSRAAGE